jgi:hypothetical protein
MASTSQSDEVRSYLLRKVPVRGPEDDDFWPWKHPDTHYIPFCSVCKSQYEEAKGAPSGTKIDWDHSSACLWYDYFVGKLRTANEDIIITHSYGKKERKSDTTNDVKSVKKTNRTPGKN